MRLLSFCLFVSFLFCLIFILVCNYLEFLGMIRYKIKKKYFPFQSELESNWTNGRNAYVTSSTIYLYFFVSIFNVFFLCFFLFSFASYFASERKRKFYLPIYLLSLNWQFSFDFILIVIFFYRFRNHECICVSVNSSIKVILRMRIR